MKLKIKKAYLGQILTRKTDRYDSLTLDTNNVPVEDYEFYYNNGFKDVFTRVKLIKYKGI